MIGARIKALREHAEMSQFTLADRLGVSRASVAQWETGRSNPTTSRLRSIASVFGVTVESLIPDLSPSEKASAAMALEIRNLSVLAYAQGFTLWHVKARALRDVLTAGYFADATAMLAKGDQVHVSAPDGGAVLYVGEGASVHMMSRTADLTTLAVAA